MKHRKARESSSLWAAANIVKQGGLIAYPTDTVYGIGCLARKKRAVKRIVTLKRRSKSKGMILLTDSFKRLRPYVHKNIASRYLRAHTVPSTLLLQPKKGVLPLLKGQHTTIAVRLCNHPQTKRLLALCGGTLISTSANISGKATPLNNSQLDHEIKIGVDLVLNGDSGSSKPSQIIHYTKKRVIRR